MDQRTTAGALGRLVLPFAAGESSFILIIDYWRLAGWLATHTCTSYETESPDDTYVHIHIA